MAAAADVELGGLSGSPDQPEQPDLADLADLEAGRPADQPDQPDPQNADPETDRAGIKAIPSTLEAKIRRPDDACVPVAVCVKLSVSAANEPAFHDWIGDVATACSAFEGHIGSQLLIPPQKTSKSKTQTKEFAMIFRFDTVAHLRAWLGSREREEALRAGQHLLSRDVADADLSVSMGDVAVLDREFFAGSPPPPARPPARWRLALIVFAAVYLSVLPTAQAELVPSLMREWRFSLPQALFVVLTCTVPVLTFSFIPLLARPLRGWLARPRDPRAGWLRSTLDDGFAIFQPFRAHEVPPAVAERLERLEGRVESLGRAQRHWARRCRRAEARLHLHTAAPRHGGGGGGPTTESDTDTEAEPGDAEAAREFVQHQTSRILELSGPEAPENTITVVLAHRVRFAAFDEYERRVQELARAARRNAAGYRGASLVRPTRGNEYTVVFEFDAYANLKAWVESHVRTALVARLQPLLDRAAGGGEEEALRTAGSAAHTRGHSAVEALFMDCSAPATAVAPPPLWKMSLLTTVGLFLIAWPVAEQLHLSYSLPVSVAVTSAVNVAVNSYVFAPLMTSIFDAWLRAPRPEFHEQPWRALDRGFETVWGQLAVLAGFYGVCVVLLVW